MTLSSENSFFNKNESSKSHTLKFLSRRIEYSKIEKIYDFTVSEWIDDYQNIVKKYKENLVVIKLSFEVLQSVKIQLKNPMPEIIKVF